MIPLQLRGSNPLHKWQQASPNCFFRPYHKLSIIISTIDDTLCEIRWGINKINI